MEGTELPTEHLENQAPPKPIPPPPPKKIRFDDIKIDPDTMNALGQYTLERLANMKLVGDQGIGSAQILMAELVNLEAKFDAFLIMLDENDGKMDLVNFNKYMKRAADVGIKQTVNLRHKMMALRTQPKRG